MISRSIIGQNLLGSFRKCTHLYKIVGSSVSKSVAPFRFYLGALNVFPQILCFSKVSLSFLKAISNFQNGDTCLRFQLVMDRSTDGPADGWMESAHGDSKTSAARSVILLRNSQLVRK